MQHQEQIEWLKSHNELLQLQLEEVNAVLAAREEELAVLKEAQHQFAAYKSEVETNVQEEQNFKADLEKAQEQNRSADFRVVELEKELLQNLKQLRQAELALADLKTVQADLNYTESELQQADGLYEELQQLKNALAASNSLLELSKIEAAEYKAALNEQANYFSSIKNKDPRTSK